MTYSNRVEPSITAVSFSCPHCGALAHQRWHDIYAYPTTDNATPLRGDSETLESMKTDANIPEESRESLVGFVNRLIGGGIFLDTTDVSGSKYQVHNVSVSICYSCSKSALWVHDRIVHPPTRIGIEPNPDLPEEIARDFNEARLIVELSPRGAAALLRLSIQKLCAHLGEAGQNINSDIASLVKKGLDPRIQRALDVVRVIGNDAVHPGAIDLRDDRDTATNLFRLVNLIAERMISDPKHVEELYQRLPEGKRKAIEDRDR